MRSVTCLSSYLSGAPAASCLHHDPGDMVVCRAKGKARNTFPFCAASLRLHLRLMVIPIAFRLMQLKTFAIGAFSQRRGLEGGS